jgi:hypothetical protein
MNIQSLWPTNILIDYVYDKEYLSQLITIGKEYENKHPEAHVPFAMRKNKETSYNLLQDSRKCCREFKEYLKTNLAQLAIAENYNEPEKIKFEAVANLRTFGPNEYAKPHNHRSVDYVAVLFLQVGITDNCTDVHQKMAGNRLHLIDPIPMRHRYMNHQMLHPIRPVEGMFVIHPASIFHTTELNLSNKDLIAVVSNIRVIDDVRNYEEL